MTSKDELHAAMMEWLFSDTGIAARMEEFANSYCAYFDYVEDRGDFAAADNKLVYTQIFKTFQELFEGELTTFLSSHGWSTENFLTVCQEATEGKEDNRSWASAYEILMSLSDYDVFKMMMMDTRRKFPDMTTVQA